MSAAQERATSPVPAGVAIPSDRDADACVLVGEVGAANSFYDLLSFLGRARWRGELIVQIDDLRRSIFFDEGNVVGAQTQAPAERIGEILRAAGLLSDAQVEACIERQGDGSLRFGEAAVELGFLTDQALFRAMDRQLEAIFAAVVTETRGAFYFFLGYDDESLSYRQRHRVDSLLVKAISRIEETEYFQSRIPSSDHVPVRLPEHGTPAEDPLGVYAAIDGRRSVGSVCERCSGAAEVDVVRALFELVQAGHVAIEPPRIGCSHVIEVYNRAITLLLRELDAMDEGDEVREKLARFAADAPSELFAGAGPADDGTFDGPKVEGNAAAIADAEERVASWLYDYASYALFLARPHLQRRYGDHPPRDEARVSMRVAALLAPLAPRGLETLLPDGLLGSSGATPRTTLPVLSSSNAPPKGTIKLPRAKILELPGIDPSRTVRMKPVSQEMLARRTNAAADPAQPPASSRGIPRFVPPPAAPVAPAALPVRVAPPPAPPAARSELRLSVPAFVGAVAVAAGIAGLGAAALLRGSGAAAAHGGAHAELVVVCEPECSAVHVDGSPLAGVHGAFDVPPGAHEIVASKPGFRTELKRVSVNAGESRAVAFVLTQAH